MLTQEEVELWIRELHSATVVQCTTGQFSEAHGASGEREYCVWGVLGLVLGQAPHTYYTAAGAIGRELARMNDSGSSFQELAQWIEENKEKFSISVLTQV